MSVSFSPVSQALSNSNITIKSILFHSYSLTFLHFFALYRCCNCHIMNCSIALFRFCRSSLAAKHFKHFSWPSSRLSQLSFGCLSHCVWSHPALQYHTPWRDELWIGLDWKEKSLHCCDSSSMTEEWQYFSFTFPFSSSAIVVAFCLFVTGHLFLFPSLSWSVPFHPEVYSGNSVWLWKSICLLLFLTLSGYVIISPSHFFFFICLHRPFHQHFCCRGSTVGLL